jgi:hypothetical protein
VRTHHLLQLAALFALTACASNHRSTAAQAATAAQSSPAPLHGCETRELTLDDADIVVNGNIDGTLASYVIVRAPSPSTRARAIVDVRNDFGLPRPDTQIIAHQSKWGLTTYTDRCGHPVGPGVTPSSSP